MTEPVGATETARAAVEYRTPEPGVGSRAMEGAHDAYQALADRKGARSIVFGGTVAAVAGVVLVRKLVTR